MLYGVVLLIFHYYQNTYHKVYNVNILKKVIIREEFPKGENQSFSNIFFWLREKKKKKKLNLEEVNSDKISLKSRVNHPVSLINSFRSIDHQCKFLVHLLKK